MQKTAMSIRFRPPKAYIVSVGRIDRGRRADGSEYTRPVSQDHFSIYNPQTDENGNYIRALDVEQTLIRQGFGRGDKLERVPVFLTANDLKLNVQTFLALYGKGVCWCRSLDFNPALDTNKARRRVWKVVDKKREPTGEEVECSCPCEYYGDGKACSEYTKFFFQIKGFERLGAMSLLRTKSWHTRNSIFSSLAMLSMQLRGFIAGIPLVMSVQWVRKEGKQFPVVHVMSEPLMGKTLLELVREAQSIPAIDATPAAREYVRGIFADRELEILEPEDVRETYAFVEPEDHEPPALPPGAQMIEPIAEPAASPEPSDADARAEELFPDKPKADEPKKTSRVEEETL